MTAPAIINGFNTFYKDPDNIDFYWGDITQELIDRGTTASSVVEIVQGVTVAIPTVIVIDLGRTWCKVKLGGLDITGNPPVNFCTFRVTCANTEQFDRTIKFLREDH